MSTALLDQMVGVQAFDQDAWRYREDHEIEWDQAAVDEEDDSIVLFAPLPMQEEAIASPARFKLERAGRRGGKSRGALYCATLGHGPVTTMGEGEDAYELPLWKGMIHGVPILWLAPDIPQATAIWEEEILPRFEGKAGVVISKKHHVVKVGRGSIRIVSFQNVDSVRGKKFGGAVMDECAHYDLEYAWHSVVRPALADMRGWAIFPSTPNFGTDHPKNVERKHDQSYFNVLCHKELARELGERWAQFHWTMFDNPKIDPEEAEEIKAEYKDKPDSYDQEILAKLLEGIEGVFFREFSQKVHVRRAVIPESARWGMGLDWGFSSPGCAVLSASWQGPYGRRRHVRMDFEFQRLTPYRAGYALGKAMMRFPKPEYIAADSSMWDTGDGQGEQVEPVADKFQKGLNDACGKDRDGQSLAPLLVKAPKGKGSREVRALAYRELLKHGEPDADGVIPAWAMPILSIEPGAAPHLVRCLEILPTDPKNPELPATEGVYDHSYDADSYEEVFRKAPVEGEGEGERRARGPASQDHSYADQKFKIRQEREDEYERESRRRFGGRGGRRG